MADDKGAAQAGGCASPYGCSGGQELSQYCRRRTCGVETTISLIELGAHLACAEMPHRVHPGHARCDSVHCGRHHHHQGVVILTRYRCTRGSTSVESFHCQAVVFLMYYLKSFAGFYEHEHSLSGYCILPACSLLPGCCFLLPGCCSLLPVCLHHAVRCPSLS